MLCCFPYKFVIRARTASVQTGAVLGTLVPIPAGADVGALVPTGAEVGALVGYRLEYILVHLYRLEQSVVGAFVLISAVVGAFAGDFVGILL